MMWQDGWPTAFWTLGGGCACMRPLGMRLDQWRIRPAGVPHIRGMRELTVGARCIGIWGSKRISAIGV
ncbi:hypothetical protein PNOK_0276000 [Pyrrhoderma noxium]|uniref:Uncharacterized protein n=1 Tax=Pyrrhoderma noxium TaxID=2282107 RepID=A0A286UT71_9AGAM|nr:hypothetical protein PNOK_0276000 [Pyrrhoderma noxium]